MSDLSESEINLIESQIKMKASNQRNFGATVVDRYLEGEFSQSSSLDHGEENLVSFDENDAPNPKFIEDDSFSKTVPLAKILSINISSPAGNQQRVPRAVLDLSESSVDAALQLDPATSVAATTARTLTNAAQCLEGVQDPGPDYNTSNAADEESYEAPISLRAQTNNYKTSM